MNLPAHQTSRTPPAANMVIDQCGYASLKPMTPSLAGDLGTKGLRRKRDSRAVQNLYHAPARRGRRDVKLPSLRRMGNFHNMTLAASGCLS